VCVPAAFTLYQDDLIEVAGTVVLVANKDRVLLIDLNEGILADGDSPTVMTDLASYYAMVGQRDRGNELLETVTRQEIRDPLLMGSIAESFEDLGDRDQAIEWLGRALNDGLDIKWLERRPSFNSLRSDERFLEIVQKSTKSS